MPGLLAAIVCAAVAQSGSELVLRGGEPAPGGAVQAVTPEGVVVGSSVTAPVIVGWDRVREVRGAMADEAAMFGEVADSAWRARIRLERGDVPAAEPLYERLFVRYQDGQGPTAAMVSEGLLRCRLRRSAHTLATGAWLSWLHARSTGDGPQWYQRRVSEAGGEASFAIDEATGLIPELPPIWIDLPAVEAFAKSPPDTSGFAARERDLAALYVHAARLAAGGTGSLPRTSSGDPAVRLVGDIVAAQSADAAERAGGRKAVESRLRQDPLGWQDAWLRTALGRSLLLEDAPADRERGVIELLRVRVTHASDAPYLAGLALAQAAVALADAGEAGGAGVLRRELLDRFPGHPATSWDRIVVWPDAGARGAPAAAGRAPKQPESRTANG